MEKSSEVGSGGSEQQEMQQNTQQDERIAESERVAEILGTGKGKKSFFQKHFYLVSEIWHFMKERKRWWLLPIIIMLGLVGTLVIFGQASPLSPFIYALF